jgi:diadenosine tetraphosphate (Ap4A) HIT family hydrolase
MPVAALGPYDKGNIFARILRGEIPCTKVFENEYALAFQDINPQAPVHVLVIPKTAYVSFADFAAEAPPPTVAGFFKTVALVAKSLNLDEPGYRLLANTGYDAHQEVPHFHVHIFGGRALGPMLPQP